MRPIDWFTLLISLLGLILIPILILVLKAVKKAGVNEEKLDNLIESKDQTHRMLMNMIQGLDKRIRWIEEKVWGKHSG